MARHRHELSLYHRFERGDFVIHKNQLILHLAHTTDLGFDLTEVWESRQQLDAFNETVFAQAMARAGISMDGPPPQTVELDPLAVVTPRAFTSDATV